MATYPQVLVTGAAGFIGFHLSHALLKRGYSVVGLDNLNTYYDVTLKENRLAILKTFPGYHFYQYDLENKDRVDAVFEMHPFDYVINLAAQAGVRHSLTHPYSYVNTNISGFLNILEACRKHKPRHLLFASSSSVYGGNHKVPFSVHDSTDHPLALYAASKKANELMAHAYSNLFHIPVTGLRFFSVYGPLGRPDMALFIFTKAILSGTPIDIYNFGRMARDFTYVEDLVEGIIALIPQVPQSNEAWDADKPDPATSWAPYRILNIGNNQPVELTYFIETLESKLQRKALKNFLPIQTGDVDNSASDISDLEKVIGRLQRTSIEVGIGHFVDWYLSYYKD
ncbi:MAG TPA: NAD-dependent epimerase/dehydratase family protein [Cyclobacteriaceae bacterium]|nr:NAD-dependent epimerase/dehydratase family protein [Cyclobacteriaceae bacterium]